MKRVHRELSAEAVEQLRRSVESRVPRVDSDIGALIRDMRLVLKQSQAEYARTCGVAVRVLAEIESGKGNPGIRTVERLLAPYGFQLGVVRPAPEKADAMRHPEASAGTHAPPSAGPAGLPRALAFIDEAGEKGYTSRLRPEHDDRIAVMAAVLVPALHERNFEKRLRPAYERFRSQAPAGEKLHMSAALKPGNEAWARTAREARTELFDVAISVNARIVYVARRMRVLRSHRDMLAGILPVPATDKRVGNLIRKVPRDHARIDTDAFEMLLLLLEEFGRQTRHVVVPVIDRVDQPILKAYNQHLVEHRNFADREDEYKAFDTAKKRTVSGGRVRMQVLRQNGRIAADLNATHLDDVVTLHHVTPISLLADMVVHSLYRHLNDREPTAPLNVKSALVGWPLADITALIDEQDSVLDRW